MKRQLALDAAAALLVAAVVGTLAYPLVQGHLFRARQAEAKNNLILIHTLEQAYFQARGAYRSFKDVGPVPGKKKDAAPVCGDAELGFKLGACERARYAYSTEAKGSEAFVAKAQAPAYAIVPDCKVEDTWEIDQARKLRAAKGRDALQACRR